MHSAFIYNHNILQISSWLKISWLGRFFSCFLFPLNIASLWPQAEEQIVPWACRTRTDHLIACGKYNESESQNHQKSHERYGKWCSQERWQVFPTPLPKHLFELLYFVRLCAKYLQWDVTLWRMWNGKLCCVSCFTSVIHIAKAWTPYFAAAQIGRMAQFFRV